MAKRHVAHPVLQRFGGHLRSIRDRQGLTREQLGELLETDAKNIYRLESGTENVSLIRASRIADALQVPLVELLSAHDAPSLDWAAELNSLGWRAVASQPEGSAGAKTSSSTRRGLPVLDLRATAASALALPFPAVLGTARSRTGRKLNSKAMFLGRIAEGSMAPRIPENAWCLFERNFNDLELLGADVLLRESEPGQAITWIVRRVQQIAIGEGDAKFMTVHCQDPTRPPRQLRMVGSNPVEVIAILREMLGCAGRD